nr:hypothetical protein [Pandoravirus aubagnensis]
MVQCASPQGNTTINEHVKSNGTQKRTHIHQGGTRVLPDGGINRKSHLLLKKDQKGKEKSGEKKRTCNSTHGARHPKRHRQRTKSAHLYAHTQPQNSNELRRKRRLSWPEQKGSYE